MSLPEPSTIEPLSKKVPQRYANDRNVLDFMEVLKTNAH